MKFALLSDLHLLWQNPVARLDNLVEVQFDKLSYVLDWCRNNDAILLQAGDFNDRPRSWAGLPQIITFLKRYGVKIYCVAGQHDYYMYSEESRPSTTLGILNEIELVKILNEKFIGLEGEDIFLYGCSFGEKIPEIRDRGDFNILVIHAPIAEEPLFPNQNYMDAKKFLKENKDYEVILCGDIHREFCIKIKDRIIINTGCMLRKTADEYNFQHKPCFYSFDTDTKEIEKHIIPHKPAKEILSRNHIENKVETDLILDEFVKSIQDVKEFSGVNIVENLFEFIREHGIPKDIQNIITCIVNNTEERKEL